MFLMAMQSMQLEQGQSIPGIITDLNNAVDHPQLHNQVL